SRSLALLSRYESRLHRMHERTYRTLRQLQQERLTPAQPEPLPAPQPPQDPSDPPKASSIRQPVHGAREQSGPRLVPIAMEQQELSKTSAPLRLCGEGPTI